MNILLLTDFSESAWNAAQYAVQLAGSAKNSRVILYHSVIHVPTAAIPTGPIFTQGYFPESFDEDALMAGSLQRLADLAAVLEPFASAGTIIEYRSTLKPLIDAATELSAAESIDLVIAGSKDHSRISELLVGSNAAELIDTLRYPLLVIPPNTTYKPVERMVFACELKDIDKLPSARIKALCSMIGSKLLVLNVDPRPHEEDLAERLQLEEQLCNLIGIPHADYHQLVHPYVGESIRFFAEAKKADQLLVVHKQHGFFYRILHGSTTRQLLLHGSVPILVMKEDLI